MNTIPDIAYLILGYLIEPCYEFANFDGIIRHCNNPKSAYEIIKYFRNESQINKNIILQLSMNPSPRIIRLLRYKNLNIINPLCLVANTTKDPETIQWIYTYSLEQIKLNISDCSMMLLNSRNMEFTLYCLSRLDIINRYKSVVSYGDSLRLFALIENFPTKEFALKLVEIAKSYDIYDHDEFKEFISKQCELVPWLVDEHDLIDWNSIIHNKDPELYLMAFSLVNLVEYKPLNPTYQKLYQLFKSHHIENIPELIEILTNDSGFTLMFYKWFDSGQNKHGLDIMKHLVQCEIINRTDITKIFNKYYCQNDDVFINKFGPRLVRAVYRKI